MFDVTSKSYYSILYDIDQSCHKGKTIVVQLNLLNSEA